MLRRIAIAAGIFVMLFLAVFVYNHVAGEEDVPAPTGEPQQAQTRQATSAPRPLGSGRFNIQRRDDDGNLLGVYKADKSRKLSDNTFALTRPLITLYRPTGERIYIFAQTGMLYATEVGTEFEPRRGLLKGKVRVFIDRSTDPTRPAELTPDRDLVRIYGDQVEFDADDLAIRVGGDVAILSAEADIFGRDLSISWNEAPKTDLKLLRLAHGRSMIVYEAEDILSDSAGPGASGRAPAGRRAKAAAYFPWPAGALTGLVRTAGGAPPTAQAPKPRNIYLATFHHDVHVFSGQRSMRYARRLAVTFEWDREVQGLPGRDRKRPRTTGRPVPVPLIAMTASGASPADPPTGRPSTYPATRPAERKKTAEPTVILWSGPLVVEPIGRSEAPSTRRYRIEAEGRRIVWETEDLAAVCSRFTMRQQFDGQKTVQEVDLIGTEAEPVRLARTGRDGGQRIRCTQITYLPHKGRAELVGPGRIVAPPPDGRTDDPLLALDLDELPDPPGGDRVAWSEALVATLQDAEPTGAKRNASPPKAVTSAVLTGVVELAQAESGNFLRCDRMLQIWTSPSRPGRARASRHLSRAKATGNVRALQEGRNITADEMTVEFAERRAEPAAAARPAGRDTTRAGSLTVGSVRATRLQADGRVKITDTRSEKPLVATADTLQTNLVDEKAVLEGAPARILQGDTALRGPRIHLDQAAESLVVVGAGQLRFNTDRDLDGEALKAPRPLVTTWNKQMTFTGKKDSASFAGGVTVVSGDDKLSAGEMDVTFEKVASPKPAPKDPADTSARQRAAASIAELGVGKRRLKTIVCRRDVVMDRVRNNAIGRLIQQVRLTGDQLTYNASAGKDDKTARMTVDGPGMLFLGDYDLPEGKAAADKPSQTLFVWKRGMAFSQKDRQVVLHGGVSMKYRTGNQIVKAERLNIPAMGRLPPGRNVAMTCQKMIASFGDAKPAARRAMTLGRLRQFRAIGKVDLAEGPIDQRRRMLGEVLSYDRVKEIVVAEGTRSTPAMLTYNSTAQETLKTVRSRRIECYLKDNVIVRVRTAEITGGG